MTLRRRFLGFIASQEGSVTFMSLLFFVALGMIGGLALDFTSVIAARTQLQVAADVAAHGALYHRETYDADQSKAKAIELAQAGMPSGKFGDVLTTEDISFGYWDYDDQVFSIDETSRSAVLVTTSRSRSRSNSVSTYLLRWAGIYDFDVVTQAVFVAYRPACFREGFVAEEVVDIQSNNSLSKGFCIHSNTYVSVNQNNTYEPGTVVSMPDENDIDLPKSGFDKNAGLEEALHSAAYRMRIISDIEPLIHALSTGDENVLPDYITNPSPLHLSGGNFSEVDFPEGRIYFLGCNQNTRISGAAPIARVVIIADCEVSFGQGTILEDVVIANASTSLKSFNAPSSFQIGRDDSCSEGGGAQLITRGGVSFASGLRLYGGQILAERAVQFSANADGVEGASVVSGETIDGTSNTTMGFCNGSGMEDNFEADYFRLAT
ncbi:TadE/TadG family type IV pilus assembly protein [Palleronia sp.]|uniref:TadE/TadG family type IV pilus assembly protein n=1 Tax=Palleronia sp. TaxID=1940284 RepID=UPI0035C7FCD4